MTLLWVEWRSTAIVCCNTANITSQSRPARSSMMFIFRKLIQILHHVISQTCVFCTSIITSHLRTKVLIFFVCLLCNYFTFSYLLLPESVYYEHFTLHFPSMFKNKNRFKFHRTVHVTEGYAHPWVRYNAPYVSCPCRLLLYRVTILK